MSLDEYRRLPARRAERRVIFVMDRAAIEWMEADPSGREVMLREDAAVLYSGIDVDEADPVTQRLERQGLLVPGLVLVASPYRDGDYAPLEAANNRFSLEKWASVSTLCVYLGARTLSVQVVEDTKTQSKWTASAGGGVKGVEATATATGRSVDAFAGQMHWDDSYVGGVGNLELARDYLLTSGLEADPEIRSLVDARAHPGNLLARRTLVVDLSRESERALDTVLSINPPAILSFSAQFERARESKANYRLTLEIVFPDA